MGEATAIVVVTLMVALLYAVAETWPFSFEYRGETAAFTLNGIPLAVGLVFGGPLPTLVGRLLGTALSLRLYHQQSSIKMLVNLVGMSLEIWAAAHVFRAIAGGSVDMGTPMAWLAVSAAVIAADTITVGVMLVAIRMSVGRLEAGTWRTLLLGNTVNLAVGIPLAVLTALALTVDARTAVVLTPVAAILLLTTRQRHNLSARLGTTQQLYRFISDLAEHTSLPDTMERVLERAQSVTGATRAQLILLMSDDLALCWQVTAEGVVAEEVSAMPVRRMMQDAAGGRLLSAGDPLLTRYASVLPVAAEQVILAPLAQADVRGLLVLADRAGNLALYDEDDVQVVFAIAGHTGTALAEAGLLERLRAEAIQRQRMALTDSQTGMPNRAGLLAEVSSLTHGMVLVVEARDLTEFEAGFGHAVAEGIATTVADRVARVAQTRPDTIVARLSSGRYAVVCQSRVSQTDAALLARHLVEVGSGTVEQGDLVIDVAVRVGVAMAPSHGSDVAELLRAADRGLRDATEQDRAIGWFDVQRDRETTRRLELASELRIAIEGGHLQLAYQPKVDLASGRVVGVEALARWPHADRGFIPTQEFIDIAERTGLIRPLTLWAMRTALRQAADWSLIGRNLQMAVNLSNAALLDSDIARAIVAMIARLDLPNGSVMLEITESQVMSDVQRGGGALSIFNASGVSLSLDDFGTGYSSLAHLKTLDVRELKIDRAFVTNIANDSTDRALCSAIIGMAGELGLQVVGEGIEDEAALRILRNLGCQVGQGHFFARPVPANQLLAVVAEIEGRFVDGSVARLQDRARRQQ
ncbi:MAG TPA: sensor domain-containing phosphodiesterase [Euzebya sp.]|nr:sensor domain-containing phosphodiesterase [Euzebya sp.]